MHDCGLSPVGGPVDGHGRPHKAQHGEEKRESAYELAARRHEKERKHTSHSTADAHEQFCRKHIVGIHADVRGNKGLLNGTFPLGEQRCGKHPD